jgi:hypothetical protein
VDKEVSTGNLGIYKSKFNDKNFMSELGFGDDKEPTKEQFREAALKRFRGELTLSDLNTLVEDYDKHRTQTPIARAKAEEMSATQRGTLQTLLMMDDKYTQAMSKLYQSAMDPQTIPQKTAMHVQMLQKQYENVFSYWYMQTMQENGGQPPSGKQLQDIMKITMETVKGDAASMSLMLFANSQQNMREGFNPQMWAERQASIGQMFDPTVIAQRYIAPDAAVEQALRTLPEGSRMILTSEQRDATGKVVQQAGLPSVDAEGNYSFLLPNGTRVLYNPVAEAQVASPQGARAPYTEGPRFGPDTKGSIPRPQGQSSTPLPPIPRPDIRDMSPAQGAAELRKYNETVRQTQQEESRRVFREKQDERIEQSVNTQFDKDVQAYALRMVQEEFKNEILSAKPSELPAIRERLKDRQMQLTEYYTTELRPIYDAFVQARTALDNATPSQRKAAKEVYRKALEAWKVFNQ